MDRQIRRLGVAFVVLFLLLFAQLNYIQVFAQKRLADNPANTRTLLQEYSVKRGEILARDERTVLAVSTATKDLYKYLRTYPKGSLYGQLTGYYSLIFGRSFISLMTVSTWFLRLSRAFCAASYLNLP